jgi:hypothetical protein
VSETRILPEDFFVTWQRMRRAFGVDALVPANREG